MNDQSSEFINDALIEAISIMEVEDVQDIVSLLSDEQAEQFEHFLMLRNTAEDRAH